METAQALSRIAVALESLDSKFMFVPVWLGIWVVVGLILCAWLGRHMKER